MSRGRPFSRDVGGLDHLTDGDAPSGLAVLADVLPEPRYCGPAGARARTHRTNGNLMALIACPNCSSENINGTPQADSRLLIHCNDCGHEWLRGEARRDPGRPAVRTIDSLHAAFPTTLDVRPDVRERVALLASEFRLDHRGPGTEAADQLTKYQELFSRDGLPGASPDDLLEFATTDVVASAGNMSGLTRAW